MALRVATAAALLFLASLPQQTSAARISAKAAPKPAVQATQCPGNYPKCDQSGNCRIASCAGGGCGWSKAPTADADPAGFYNYIHGHDALGARCTGDFAQVQLPEAASAPTSPGEAAEAAVTAALRGPVPQVQQLEPPSWSEHPINRLWVLLAGLSFAVFIKGACLVGNVLVQVSPLPDAQHWTNKGCTGEADAAPYIALAYNGWQWSYYGIFAYILTGKSGFLILVQSNCLGAVLGSYYVYTFFRNCTNPSARASMQQYLTAYAILITMQASAALVLPLPRALFLAGVVSSFCAYLGAMSMLVTVPAVLRTQNSSSIPGTLVMANFAGGVAWTICGMILADPMVIGPNIFCTLACAFCISLRLRFPDKGAVCEASGDCGMARRRLVVKPDRLPFAKHLAVEHGSGLRASAAPQVGKESGGPIEAPAPATEGGEPATPLVVAGQGDGTTGGTC